MWFSVPSNPKRISTRELDTQEPREDLSVEVARIESSKTVPVWMYK